MTTSVRWQVGALMLALAVSAGAAAWGAQMDPAIGGLMGAGPWETWMTCFGCAGIGAAAVMSGWATAWFFWHPGGLLAAGACATACVSALI